VNDEFGWNELLSRWWGGSGNGGLVNWYIIWSAFKSLSFNANVNNVSSGVNRGVGHIECTITIVLDGWLYCTLWSLNFNLDIIFAKRETFIKEWFGIDLECRRDVLLSSLQSRSSCSHRRLVNRYDIRTISNGSSLVTELNLMSSNICWCILHSESSIVVVLIVKGNITLWSKNSNTKIKIRNRNVVVLQHFGINGEFGRQKDLSLLQTGA